MIASFDQLGIQPFGPPSSKVRAALQAYGLLTKFHNEQVRRQGLMLARPELFSGEERRRLGLASAKLSEQKSRIDWMTQELRRYADQAVRDGRLAKSQLEDSGLGIGPFLVGVVVVSVAVAAVLAAYTTNTWLKTNELATTTQKAIWDDQLAAWKTYMASPGATPLPPPNPVAVNQPGSPLGPATDAITLGILAIVGVALLGALKK